MKKTKSLFAQLHEANEKIKQIEKKYKSCWNCRYFNNYNNKFNCEFHLDDAKITDPKQQICENFD